MARASDGVPRRPRSGAKTAGPRSGLWVIAMSEQEDTGTVQVSELENLVDDWIDDQLSHNLDDSWHQGFNEGLGQAIDDLEELIDDE